MRADARTAARQPECRLTADAVVVAARPDGSVDLEFAPRKGCEGCAGTCLWRRLSAMRIDDLRIEPAFPPGTPVSVTIADRVMLVSALAAWGVPLFSVLAGAAVGAALTGSDLGTLAGIVLALVIVLAGFSRFRRRLERSLLASLVIRLRT